ncbi:MULTISPECIES: glycosyltransferase family 4 protein [Actinomadura]|uniref:Glycosyltransferase family 4 protein n=1 Tax=Actinomadura yumaensis TaxID=111807 RepID=A0ABW2CT99_9ACTN|nr:glycosyltransferase family 4 protein [Actinomadura sp. J1-007]MWK37751.1 glycosyltransferase [Actinomadura sp. J1-007]
MSSRCDVAVVLPGDADDPTAPSGGNVYGRRVCEGLEAAGRTVRRVAVAGTWPRPDASARSGLGAALDALPAGTAVLLDGLVACGVPGVVAERARRLRQVVLVHLPLSDETGLDPRVAAELNALEGETLRAAHAVVATSAWAAERLRELHGPAVRDVHVVEPGVDAAPEGSGRAPSLLCVASLTPRKGQDLLVEALYRVADLDWTCRLVGPAGRDPAYAERVRDLIAARGLRGRIGVAGPLTGEPLAAAYATAGLLVLPSRAETYGMVVTEALARGIPVVATEVGGVPGALGSAPDGTVPGVLVPPDDADALADALRRWLTDERLRISLRASARARRTTLTGWDETSQRLAAVLHGVQENGGPR